MHKIVSARARSRMLCMCMCANIAHTRTRAREHERKHCTHRTPHMSVYVRMCMGVHEYFRLCNKSELRGWQQAKYSPPVTAAADAVVATLCTNPRRQINHHEIEFSNSLMNALVRNRSRDRASRESEYRKTDSQNAVRTYHFNAIYRIECLSNPPTSGCDWNAGARTCVRNVCRMCLQNGCRMCAECVHIYMVYAITQFARSGHT